MRRKKIKKSKSKVKIAKIKKLKEKANVNQSGKQILFKKAPKANDIKIKKIILQPTKL